MCPPGCHHNGFMNMPHDVRFITFPAEALLELHDCCAYLTTNVFTIDSDFLISVL